MDQATEREAFLLEQFITEYQDGRDPLRDLFLDLHLVTTEERDRLSVLLAAGAAFAHVMIVEPRFQNEVRATIARIKAADWFAANPNWMTSR